MSENFAYMLKTARQGGFLCNWYVIFQYFCFAFATMRCYVFGEMHIFF